MSFLIICCMFRVTTSIKLRTLYTLFILLAVFITIVEIISLNVDPMILDYAISWVLEPIESLLFSSSKALSLGESGDILIHKMYFSVEDSTFLWGDGFYEPNGVRYMGTDAAFMRKVLYGGIIQISLLYISAVFLLIGYYRRYRSCYGQQIIKIICLSGLVLLMGEFKDTLYPKWYVIMVMYYITQLSTLVDNKIK